MITPNEKSRSTRDGGQPRLKVTNTGDRPVQVGSHFHFFEANRHLDFDREAAFGMRLDIPAGTAVRFEPGSAQEVTLVEFGGEKSSHRIEQSHKRLGKLRKPCKKNAIRLAKERGFKGVE